MWRGVPDVGFPLRLDPMRSRWRRRWERKHLDVCRLRGYSFSGHPARRVFRSNEVGPIRKSEIAATFGMPRHLPYRQRTPGQGHLQHRRE